MPLMIVAAGLLVPVALASWRFHNKVDPLARRERALAALRDLAAVSRPIASELPTRSAETVDHVRILEPAPAETRSRPARSAAARHRRPASARQSARRRAVASVEHARRTAADRPTIAVLPTVGGRRDAPGPPTDPVAPSAAERSPVTGVRDEAPERVAPVDHPRQHGRARATFAAASAIAITAAAVSLGVAVASGGHRSRVRTAPVAPLTHPSPPSTRAHTPRAPTAPPKVQLVALANGDATITVRVPFTLTLRATGPCWVQARTDHGHTLFEGTLQAGQTQTVTSAEPLVVRFGNTPAMTLVVDRTQLDLSGVARTANLQFQT